MRAWRSVVALSGGVGGARLVHGLDRVLQPGALTTIVNTGDDFEHWGLSISPDLDTVMYTLADLADVARGWGLAEETFHGLAMVKRYGGDDWFALGDADLATHVLRTAALRGGERLTQVTAHLAASLGVRSRILPMCDARFRTLIDTAEMGTLEFQQWLVRRRAEPAVTRVHFDGATEASADVMRAIGDAELIVLGPSNPYVSIDPILSLRGVRDAVFSKPVIAVSPLVAGKAVKGPLSTMVPQLEGREPSVRWLVEHYRDVRAWVVERGDAAGLDDITTLATDTVMHDRDDSRRLAESILAFAERW
jgi:LPPG:FO 2-phospho-L-lactate transferase